MSANVSKESRSAGSSEAGGEALEAELSACFTLDLFFFGMGSALGEPQLALGMKT